jgi:hypothetical protein
LKQYERFCTLLRKELCSNNLRDFGLTKGLEHLNACAPSSRRSRIVSPDSRRSGGTARVDFPLLQRIALPITTGSVYYAGSKIHETRFLDQGIHTSWETLRRQLSTHQVVTVRIPSADGRILCIPARYASRTNPLRHLPGAAHTGTHPLTH